MTRYGGREPKTLDENSMQRHGKKLEEHIFLRRKSSKSDELEMSMLSLQKKFGDLSLKTQAEDEVKKNGGSLKVRAKRSQNRRR